MESQLCISSAEWESQEQAKVAAAMVDKKDDPASHRSWRLSVAANGEWRRLSSKRLLTPCRQTAIGDLFPISCCTMNFRALCFKTLIKAAGGVYQAYAQGHKRFPVKLWQLWAHPHMAEQFVGIASCMKGPLTRDIEMQHPELKGLEFRFLLQALGQCVHTDTMHIESRHSSIRRVLTHHSVQTWRMGLPIASAHWIFQNARKQLHKKKIVSRKIRAAQVTCSWEELREGE